MNLHPNTFGDSPAAMYLSVLLNERGSEALARKVSRVLTTGRQVINDLVNAHQAGAITLRTLNRQLALISKFNKTEATVGIEKIDPFIAHVVINVLESSVKTWKRRGAVAAIKQRGLGRVFAQGESIPGVIAIPVPGEKNVDVVRERSRRYLVRHGKKNTLY